MTDSLHDRSSLSRTSTVLARLPGLTVVPAGRGDAPGPG